MTLQRKHMVVSYGCRPRLCFPGDFLYSFHFSLCTQSLEHVVPSQTFKRPLQLRGNWVLKLRNISDLIVIVLCYKSSRLEESQKKCGWPSSLSPSLWIHTSVQFLLPCKFTDENNIQHISSKTVAPCKY